MPTTHVVQPGECLSSIAVRHGHLPKTLEAHPENRALVERRSDLYALLPDEDRVFVPDLEAKSQEIPVNARSRFVRKGMPEMLKLRFTDADGAPRGGLDYLFEVDGVLRSGKLSADGLLEERVPLGAELATLTLRDPERGEEHYEFGLSRLAPAEELEGIQDRLRNLGYAFHDVDGVLGAEALAALERFRTDHGVSEDGEPGDVTRDALTSEYGT